MQRTGLRTLQQVFSEDADDPTAGTQVENAQQLQDAVDSGVINIEITEHVDLTGVAPADGSKFLLNVGRNSTVSIRVRFQHPNSTQNYWMMPGFTWRVLLPLIRQRCFDVAWRGTGVAA